MFSRHRFEDRKRNASRQVPTWVLLSIRICRTIRANDLVHAGVSLVPYSTSPRPESQTCDVTAIRNRIQL